MAPTSETEPEEAIAKSDEPAAQPAITADSGGAGARRFAPRSSPSRPPRCGSFGTIRSELFTRAVQPVLWLVLFGEVMARVRGIAPGNMPYLDFLAAGILAQSVLFVAIFYGISAIWERDLGVLQAIWSARRRARRWCSARRCRRACAALSQALIVYLLALLLGVGIDAQSAQHRRRRVVSCSAPALFSTFSLIIACIVKTRERFMGIGQVLTMPLFFASNAIYPLSLMPGWLSAVSHVNPLTYEVDVLRALMLRAGASDYGLALDFAVLAGVAAVLIAVAARMYARMGF